MECLFLKIICDEPRRTKKDARGGSVSLCIFVNTVLPAVPRRGPEVGNPHRITWFNDFHMSGSNSCSCPFLHSDYYGIHPPSFYPGLVRTYPCCYGSDPDPGIIIDFPGNRAPILLIWRTQFSLE